MHVARFTLFTVNVSIMAAILALLLSGRSALGASLNEAIFRFHAETVSHTHSLPKFWMFLSDRVDAQVRRWEILKGNLSDQSKEVLHGLAREEELLTLVLLIVNDKEVPNSLREAAADLVNASKGLPNHEIIEKLENVFDLDQTNVLNATPTENRLMRAIVHAYRRPTDLKIFLSDNDFEYRSIWVSEWTYEKVIVELIRQILSANLWPAMRDAFLSDRPKNEKFICAIQDFDKKAAGPDIPPSGTRGT